MLDVVIIGSGPAGLSAAIYAKRAMLEMLVIEKEPFSGGQIVKSDCVDNYLGIPGINGADLAMKFKTHADALQIPFQTGTVECIADQDDVKAITLENGTVILTKTVIIATGAKHRMLKVPGEAELTGMGVSYCATCDGAFFRGRDVAVIGGGNSAIQEALYLAKECNKVYLINRRAKLRAFADVIARMEQCENIEFIPDCEVTEIRGDGFVESITVRNTQEASLQDILVSGVFVSIGMEPATEFVADYVELEEGYIKASEDCRTSREGIFAAGDVRTKQTRQIVTAVADGACAVNQVQKMM